jgi:TetR/AcrR family transcriptional regulator, regulator of cefoperazone and chloramphenicol sensitivity
MADLIMSDTKQDPKQNILLATVACIEKKGIHSVTVRDIAGEAGANLAAINYHFGSKEKLLDATLQLTMQNALTDWEEMLGRDYPDAQHLLMEIFIYSTEGMLRYPNITRAHIGDSFFEGDSTGFFVKKFNAFLVSLADKIESIETVRTREYIELSIVQMFSAMLFAGLAPDLFRKLKKFDLHTNSGKRAFIEHLVSVYWA